MIEKFKNLTDDQHLLIIEAVVTVFSGYTGLHKFMRRNIKMGILYLCTFGLLGVGWLVDIFRIWILLIAEFRK